MTHAQDTPEPVLKALADLSTRIGATLKISDLSSWQWEQKNFPNTGLGCPIPGINYPQVLTAGYQILMIYNGVSYDYRVAGDKVVLCSPSNQATPDATAQPGVTAQPTATRPIVTGSVVCPGGLPTRLAVGVEARSTADGAINVRQYPNLTDAASVTGQLLPRGLFTVVDGPQCAADRTWWKIDYSSAGGLVSGWVIEGDNTEYWLEPTSPLPATQAPLAASGERAALSVANANLTRLFAQQSLPETVDRALFLPAPNTGAILLTHQGSLLYVEGEQMQPGTLTMGHAGQTVELAAVGARSGSGALLATVEQNPSSPANALLYLTEITPPTVTEKTGFQLPYFPNSLAFSPDGSLLAASSGSLSGSGSSSSPAVVWLWNTTTGAQIATLMQSSAAADMAFSADGSLLAVSNPTEGVSLWSTSDWSQQAMLPCQPGSLNTQSLAFTPDGQTLAVGTQNGLVILWNVAAAAERTRISMPTPDPVTFVAFSNGVLATANARLTAGMTSSGIYLWDAGTGAQLSALTAHNEAVTGLAFRDSGTLLISVGMQTWWSWAVF